MAKKKNENLPEEELNTASAEPDISEQPDSSEIAEENSAAAELAAEKEKYLRLAAEYDNFRKRSIKERESLFTDIRCDTIEKFLPVYDNIERALNQETEDKAYYEGIKMIMTQLLEILEKLGVKEIPAVSEKFDPSCHNAVMHIDDENFGDNEIVEEFQKGFMLGDKVIRFSVVKVAN